MGCVGSKPELDSPAVILCRKRCQFLDEAIHQRYALAQAHLAYFHSLKSLGNSLHRFLDLHYAGAGAGDASPVLTIPALPKVDSSSSQPPAPDVTARSNSGSSHLQFHTDSDDDSQDDDDDDDESLHLHSDNGGSSPIIDAKHGKLNYIDQHGTETLVGSYHPTVYPYPPAEFSQAGYPVVGRYTFNYMRKETTPSVLYQQRPMVSEPIKSYYNNNNNNNNYNDNDSDSHQNSNPSNYLYNDNYSNYGEFFGSQQQQPQRRSVSQAEASSSNTKDPPPPPPPPPSSGWDFLNPFETFEDCYPPYTPRDSSRVQEEESIPDFVDEVLYQQQQEEEVVKEVHGNQKFVDTDGDGNKPAVVDEKSEYRGVAAPDIDLHNLSVPNTVAKEDPVKYEVHVVDKQVVESQKKPVAFQNDSDVVKEIHTQFDRASEAGNEVAKILEVGKIPHNRKHIAYQVPSKMLNVFTPLALAPADSAPLDMDVDLLTKSKNLSSTLHKLYLWEKKLFDEVKIEEKMRLLHEDKKRRLVRLDEKGAEPHKINATRTFVASLSSKIHIAIQVIDKISEKINTMRDEELWPQINDFIQGLTRMLRSMMECHHSQCEALGAAKRIDAAIASHKHTDDASLEATLQLEHELLNWAIRFCCWFRAHKGFVRSLNEWLLQCLIYEPEETVDGPVPYSPGRIGAPLIFIVCNLWAQAMQRISDKEVVESMRDFAANVLELWERDKVEWRQRMEVDKNCRERNMDKEEQRIHKELEMLDKMIQSGDGDNKGGVVLGHAVYQSETSKNGGNLHTSMQRIFESLERFTCTSLKAYEELLKRIDDDGSWEQISQ
ncbi:uncharacterized protein [Rutidosis leptorrhynchoides]|uniref:uncharacterized protein n=1 Tax=Rutidosis leptorrhynchoides TaxID=125765 RepID=UPI003A9A3E5C